jgi:hypothetical protein
MPRHHFDAVLLMTSFTQVLALVSTRNGKLITVSEFFTLGDSLNLTVRIFL